MRPYRNAVQYTVRVLLLVALLPLLAFSENSPGPPLSPLAKRGFNHFYNMESEKAIKDFELLVKESPQDPIANNYLLTGVLFKELYRIGALDTESYADDAFLDLKPKRQFDPDVAKRVKELITRSESLCNERLAKDPNDINALYARGVARGMRSTYMGMGEKAWLSAIRSAVSARRDHERVLQLDPNFVDAKMFVGVHNYIIGSLNWFYRSMIAIAGVKGNKQKGLQYLREVANANCIASMDAKIALALFLRREQKYPEALEVVKSMSDEYPKNYMAALEYAHLLNASGKGREAAAAYRKVLEGCKELKYSICEPPSVAYNLGVTLRGQREFEEAAQAFASVSSFPEVDKRFVQRSNLAAGQMYDAAHDRETALKKYKEVMMADRSTPEAQLAKKYVDKPYRQD